MIVKLVSSMAGDRFSFRPGQVIKCSDATGGRLVEAGHAKEAQAGSEIEGELFDAPAEDKAAGDRKIEKADRPAAETPEARRAPAVEHCAGETKQGNPCASTKLVSGTNYCEKHQDQAKS